MTATTDPTLGQRRSGVLRGAAGIAVAMAVMNVTTYGFQMLAARVLGPVDYGAVAGLMALLLVLAVVQLGLQATAARRISAEPGQVVEIERAMLSVTYRAALGLGSVMLLAAPLVWLVLRLDSVVPAVLLAVTAVPLTVMGGQCGVLQGERRWLPLASVYLSMGVSRLVVGTLCIVVSPSETSAMLGVLLAMWVPVAVGYRALRRPRAHTVAAAQHGMAAAAREVSTSSLALLAFFAVSNADIVIARNVLDSHDAGLYAGGLIVTKAVLFLPQFVVVLLFPSMSSADHRRRALLGGLAVTVVMGSAATLGCYLLSDLATVFVGGAEYDEITGRLWLFGVIGICLAALQVLVYSVLARRGTGTTALLWVGLAALVVLGSQAADITALAVSVAVVDGVVVLLLLAVTARYLVREGRAD